MATSTDIETFTRRFLSSMNLTKYELAPSEETYREVKAHKLDRVAQPGDHIAVWRDKRGYWHHGIYCGEDANEDAFVVDITPEHGIACRPFESFIHGEDTGIVIDYNDAGAFTKDESLLYAKFAVDFAKECPIKYDAAKRNCDKFALLLRTGRWGSLSRLYRPKKQHRAASYSISAKLGLHYDLISHPLVQGQVRANRQDRGPAASHCGGVCQVVQGQKEQDQKLDGAYGLIGTL